MDSQGGMQLIMLGALIVVFYFFMIRPQQKRQKEIRKFREAITKGDRVVTAGGILGKVVSVGDKTFRIEISKGVDIEIDKNSVYPSAPDVASDPAQQDKIKKD